MGGEPAPPPARSSGKTIEPASHLQSGNGQANVLFPRLSRLPFLPSGGAPYICRVASSQIYRDELGLQLGAAANPSIGRLASILMQIAALAKRASFAAPERRRKESRRPCYAATIRLTGNPRGLLQFAERPHLIAVGLRELRAEQEDLSGVVDPHENHNERTCSAIGGRHVAASNVKANQMLADREHRQQLVGRRGTAGGM